MCEHYHLFLRSLPTPGRFFFQKIEFFHFLIFRSISYYKKKDVFYRPVQKLQLFIIWPMLAFLRSFLETH